MVDHISNNCTLTHLLDRLEKLERVKNALPFPDCGLDQEILHQKEMVGDHWKHLKDEEAK